MGKAKGNVAKKPDRTDAEEKTYYKGKVRGLQKRVKVLEREVSRLTKYLVQANFEMVGEDDGDITIKAPPKDTGWKCDECDHDECHELTLPFRGGFKTYFTCRQCGNRTRIVADERVDTSGE